jgi:hypothetical protein
MAFVVTAFTPVQIIALCKLQVVRGLIYKGRVNERVRAKLYTYLCQTSTYPIFGSCS